MSKKLVSDLLIDYLERRGVTKLFGLCGHTVIGMLDALSRSGFAYLGTFADYQFGAPGETTERWYIAARACKGQI